MRKFTFVHPSFDVLGGAERVALKFMEAVAEEGFPINLVTFSSFGLRKFLRNFYYRAPVRLWEYPYLMTRIPSINSGIARGLVLYPILRRLKSEHSIIVNTKFNEMPTIADVMYVHYPFYFVAAKNPFDKSLTEGPALNKMVSTSSYATYVKVSGIIGSRASRSYMGHASKVLFNSIYTYTLFKFYTGEKSHKYMILNPPIDNVYFEENYQEKGEVILIRTKGVNPAIASDIVLKLAHILRKWEIYIIGFSDKNYYEALKQKLTSASNVKVLLNIDEKTKQNLLSKATLYTHLTPYEHFGILIGEALASGCRVIVHKFSGIYYDVLMNNLYTVARRCVYVYKNYSEIPYIIKDIILNDTEPRVCKSLAEPFAETAFKYKVTRIIEDIS
jgi:glycosyltransferase involved in cell wall biosynthesis